MTSIYPTVFIPANVALKKVPKMQNNKSTVENTELVPSRSRLCVRKTTDGRSIRARTKGTVTGKVQFYPQMQN